MGVVKNFIDELAQHKFLVYFVILWGAWLFLRTVYGIAEYGFADYGHPIQMYIVDKFYHFSELIAGIILMIFGLKILNTNFLKKINNEKLIIYFILLWAAAFFFDGWWYIFDFGPAIFEEINNILGFLTAIFEVFAGILLGLFGWKLLNQTKERNIN
ncbi:MAG: hypothetical protein ACFFDT_40705 [Candidatus Hodarchaeota archaeon]